MTDTALAVRVDDPKGRLGTPLCVSIDGASPNAMLTVTLEESAWSARSSARYRVGLDGRVDLSRDAPVAGGYEGVDPMGLWWSLEPGASSQPNLEDSTYRLSATDDDDGHTASADLTRVVADDSVVAESVRGAGLVATVFAAADGQPRPGIVVLGGSEGGLAERFAAYLAGEGYTTMALGYFGIEHLPPHLCHIPIDPLASAIAVFRSRGDVTGRVGLAGASKGGELALLVAAHFPDLVDVVVGVVPSGVTFMGIGGGPRSFGCFYRSSWSLRGKPLPFVRMRMTPGVVWKTTLSRAPMRIADIYVAALANADAVDAAAIPIERFDGPVLLVSAADDGVWPSPQLADIAEARLATRTGRASRHEHVTFENAGHAFGIPYDPAIIDIPGAYMGRTAVLGGTKAGTARASIGAWARGLEFLSESLQTPSVLS